MVVHDAHGLQVRVDDRRPDEAEAPLLEIPGDPVAQLAAGGHLAALPAAQDRVAADPVPEVPAEGPELLLQGKKSLGVAHRGLDLQPVTDDPGVLQERRPAARIEAGHFGGIEARERLSIGGPLTQDGGPGESGLRAFEREHLEEMPVILHRPAPLLIVIAGVLLVGGRNPSAADFLYAQCGAGSSLGSHGSLTDEATDLSGNRGGPAWPGPRLDCRRVAWHGIEARAGPGAPAQLHRR